MPSMNRLSMLAIASGQIFLLFFLLPRTILASRNFQDNKRSEDHSLAYTKAMRELGGDKEKVAERLQQEAAEKPDDIWAFYYLGLCLIELKRFDEAAEAYQQAILIKPNEAFLHYQLGKVYIENGDLEAARKEHSWLLEKNQELGLYLSDLFPQDSSASQQTPETAQPMTAAQMPTILFREKAKYPEIAKINFVQGIVVLQVVFDVSGVTRDIRVIRGLPDGLTRNAIEAAQKIRFNPATRDGKPVSVIGNMEFSFNRY